MNILVIGNGFDLAHGLPTKYIHFMYFCSVIKKTIEFNKLEALIPLEDESYIEWLNRVGNIYINFYDNLSFYLDFKIIKNMSETDMEIYNKIKNKFVRDYIFKDHKIEKLGKEIIYLVYNNFWIDYFLQCDMHGDENWIDFESEISNIVKGIDNEMHGLDNNYCLYDKVTHWSNDFLETFFYEKFHQKITYKMVRDTLEKDLNKLIRAFEIYLAEYIEKMNVKEISPDIKNIAAKMQYGGISYSKVLNFNYTNIYSNVYLEKYTNDFNRIINHVHGKADINNTIKSNNMVLGIDEYLSDERKNRDIEFISFKKFYQRICKQTGCKYKEWIAETRRNECDLYIFGHSLDVTDKDILRELILNDNVHTTIFYHNKDVMGQQIANLVKVIGQDELIRRTGGITKTIEFKQQQDMIKRDL